MELTNHTHRVYVNGIRYADPYTALLAIIAAEDRYLRSKRAGKWAPKIQWFRMTWGVEVNMEELKGERKPTVKVTDDWVTINLRACTDFLTAAQYIRQQMKKHGRLGIYAIYIESPTIIREVCGVTGRLLKETTTSDGLRKFLEDAPHLIRFRKIPGQPIGSREQLSGGIL